MEQIDYLLQRKLMYTWPIYEDEKQISFALQLIEFFISFFQYQT